MRSRRTILGALALAAVASAIAIGVATGGHELPSAPADATWATVFKSPAAIEGLTGDEAGRPYVAGGAPPGTPRPGGRGGAGGAGGLTRPPGAGPLPPP